MELKNEENEKVKVTEKVKNEEKNEKKNIVQEI